jgi:hypothetical protein
VSVCPKEITKKEGSPGLVQDDEFVVLLLFDPENIQDGVLSPGKLGIKRLKREELSVFRPKHCSIETVQKQVIDSRLGKNPGLAFVGGVKARSGELRWVDAQANDPASRLVCVFDDPLPDFTGHAAMGFSEKTREENFWSKNQAAATLGNLCLVFEKAGVPLDLSDCF